MREKVEKRSSQALSIKAPTPPPPPPPRSRNTPPCSKGTKTLLKSTALLAVFLQIFISQIQILFIYSYRLIQNK